MVYLTNPDDDFIYDRIIKLLYEIKLVQGASFLNSTIRRHKKIRDYLHDKQVEKITNIEDRFFGPDGLDQEEIELHKQSCKK